VISIVTPAYDEAGSLPLLYERLTGVMATNGAGDWEWLIVDDHSRDETFAVVERLVGENPRVRGLRFARRSGSHAAIRCGLHHARGDAAVILAADLQDPPETIQVLLERWRAGARVVWAERRVQPGERGHVSFATLYYWMMRRVVGMTDMPARGADFCLLDRVVLDAFARCHEQNVSVLALITWFGFRQETIEYDKQPRVSGRSGWTTARKVTLVVDSLTAFSSLPIRLCSYAGVALMGTGLVMAVAAALLAPSGATAWPVILAVVVALAGLQLLALGVIGEYVWRGTDEARRRPPYLLERVVGAAPDGAGSPRDPAGTAPATSDRW
jgi:glycosyltransferase involved in cell wall biosynthesis